MNRYISSSLWLLFFSVIILCGLYPAVLWLVGQTIFPFQANGSILSGTDGQPVGSLLIAQPFTKDEYFWPRPSAASYDASASASSTLAASNYLLRDRVARALGPIVTYRSGPKAGKRVAPDIEAWFREDHFAGQPHIVAQWADAHNELAVAWVNADPSHAQYVDSWAKRHPNVVAHWAKDNPNTFQPKAADLAVMFFETFSRENPGSFPSAVTYQASDGKTVASIQPVKQGRDIQSIFFDMWRQDHPSADLQAVPADMVMTSGSGLDPHITMDNALYQLDRVANKWSVDTKRDPAKLRREIQELLEENAQAPWGGLLGEKMINVLSVNLQLRKRYGNPS
jgi:K+-transporting ATPase ATPase C chain